MERARKLLLSASATAAELIDSFEGWASVFTGLELMLVLEPLLMPLELLTSLELWSTSLDLVSRSESIEADLRDKLEMTVEAEWTLESLKVGSSFSAGFSESEKIRK